MDYPSLLASQLGLRPISRRNGPVAEERYWRDQVDLPRVELGRLVPIATTCGAILVLVAFALA
jgi:hypothetical protein